MRAPLRSAGACPRELLRVVRQSDSGDLVPRETVADVIHCDAHRAAMSLFVRLGGVLFGVLALALIAPLADGFSYENLPAVAMDYKVHIDAGKEDCYFQYVNPGATFYVSFQVSGRPRSRNRPRERRDATRSADHMVGAESEATFSARLARVLAPTVRAGSPTSRSFISL